MPDLRLIVQFSTTFVNTSSKPCVKQESIMMILTNGVSNVRVDDLDRYWRAVGSGICSADNM